MTPCLNMASKAQTQIAPQHAAHSTTSTVVITAGLLCAEAALLTCSKMHIPGTGLTLRKLQLRIGPHLILFPVAGVHLLQPLLGQIKVVLDLRRHLRRKHQCVTTVLPEAGSANAGSNFGTTYRQGTSPAGPPS